MRPSLSKINSAIKKISPKAYWKETLALLMLLLAVVFFRSERKEMHAIIPHIQQADGMWLTLGLVVTLLCVLFQAGMYVKSFKAIDLKLNWIPAAVLFLKRNFISVFLPAGGVSALAYSPSQIRKAGFNKSQVHRASGLFGFAGMLTVFIVGLPVVFYTVISTNKFNDAWLGLIAVLAIITLLFLAVRSVSKKEIIYKWIDKKFPSFTPYLNELFADNVSSFHFSGAVGYSVGVELCGILHVYIAMMALGVPASLTAAAAAYIISVLMMVISPFLRGLGAVELSMVYVLEQFGYSSAQALSITILYRVFEFWLPLLMGLIAFSWKGRKIFLRIAPALFTFALGVVNVVSAVTPPLHERISFLKRFLPMEAIHASNLLTLFTGIALLITSAFLIKGLRNAWIIAVLLSVFSLVGNMAKALDYEEATVALVTLIILMSTVQQYRIKGSSKSIKAGLKTSALIFSISILLFSFISFYFIDKRHFGVDFTWREALVHSLRAFLLVDDDSLQPVTRFGHEFIWIVRCTGFFTWAFLLYSFVRTVKSKHTANENHREKAKFLLKQYGDSSVDHFKVYKDKLIFLSDVFDAFVAYRIAGGFAIVLEEPVCAEEDKLDVIKEFDLHCRKMGLKPAFYRVDESSILWFNQLRKQKLMIGQEAILDVATFTLEGKDRKSLRNGLNSLQKKGFTAKLNIAPHAPEFVARLKKVSDEWLDEFEKNESVFSQGMFDENELKNEDIITVEDNEGNIAAFLNIIPDYAEDDCTYDLIRKTKDAPGAAMDALIVKLVDYAKERNRQFINLGLVPMTGIIEPGNTAEQLIKIATERIKRFQHYKGLREFKEKYATLWENKYLVYDNDFDLLQLPVALNTVMKP